MGHVLAVVDLRAGRAAPPPQPQFDSFKDAFSTSPTMSRVKRQRTEFTPGPGQDPPPGSMVRKRPIPEGSPSKNGVDGPPSSPMQMDDAGQDDNGMDVDLPPAASVQLVEDTDLPFVRNLRSEVRSDAVNQSLAHSIAASAPSLSSYSRFGISALYRVPHPGSTDHLSTRQLSSSRTIGSERSICCGLRRTPTRVWGSSMYL